jgi:hypothetical protein
MKMISIKLRFIIFAILLSMMINVSFALEKNLPYISTVDIDNFWNAFDHLSNNMDDESIIQKLYINKASLGLRQFIQVRPYFTAKEYLLSIRTYPKYWNTVRESTYKVKDETTNIKQYFIEIKKIYPGFSIPNVCFAISPIQTGGTIDKNGKTLLIGSEIVCADMNVDISEFHNGLEKVLGRQDVETFIVHESVHTIQKIKNDTPFFNRLLIEGCALYITNLIVKRTGYEVLFSEAYQNEKLIKEELIKDIDTGRIDSKKWFGFQSTMKIPDLGYFIGYRIAEEYYKNEENKASALENIIELNEPQKIIDISKYLVKN